MRIASWNCNGALRKKFQYLNELVADIYIVQECENPSETKHKEYLEWVGNHLWIGDNKNKGVGIFAQENIILESLDWSNKYSGHDVKYFLPCLVNNEFNLLAVWAHQNNSPNFGYIGQFWKYLQINKENFKNIIIAGDFNSNSIWDQWDRWWNHSDVVKELNDLGIDSMYHAYKNEEQGQETEPTFFMQRNPEKPYHIDYSFASRNFMQSLTNFDIGDKSEWLKISDHLPIIMTFDETETSFNK